MLMSSIPDRARSRNENSSPSSRERDLGAELAGGIWPEDARRAACTLSGEDQDGAINIELLRECAGLRYKATVGYFPDGTLGEIFLSNTKPSSQSDVNARDAAVAASLTLQFGCPLETLRHALLRDPRGNASSPLGQALDQLGDKP
jgi:hypothetical protein